ncbi:G2/mitotic-specific cyclin S13-7-like [Salvia miltiorrhiza]|uniref:G2/mitotic-specific cyclin S13-7-like n=1 Tax=Salvia miltiorrhiza TaxID=226208 RepID=UPI0025AC188C|nr:G2/mitotic-specific cyclin S13-7-like [Salvia miltiorrhiza]
MASKQVVEQRNAEEAVAAAANKQNRVAAERKSRRVLGDIGNLIPANGVVEGKQIPRISRPITRSLGARLLANAQAAQAQTNMNSLEANANEAYANAAVPQKRVVARRPAQKRVVSTKLKPEEIIEISPDSNEVTVKEKKLLSKETESKKKLPTLTSALTARSKAATIVDIDAQDLGNDLAVVEYVEEIYNFYKSVENEGRAHDYMDSQPELNERMRAILIDWLIQVHYKFELSLETLYLTINIIDRFLASKTISRRELQLVGMGAMLIASKYEEIWAPEVNDLVCISDRSFTNEQVLLMEKRILGQLEWNLTVPTPYVFLARFIKASMTGPDVENMVYFLAELGMMDYEILVHCPSMIAASAVYAARCALHKAPAWNETLQMHSGFSEQELMVCVKKLVVLHALAGDQKLKGIYRKYSSSERGGVALLSPPKFLLAD